MKKEQEYARRLEKYYRWIRTMSLTALLVCIQAFPAAALWIGQSQVNPFIEVRGVYETNEFRSETDEESDFITIISPGIHFEYPTSQNPSFRAVADYRAEIKLYGNDSDSEIDPTGELNTIAHRFDGRLDFNLASGLRFTTGYTLNLASNMPDSPARPPDKPTADTRDEYVDHKFFVQTAYTFVDRYEIQLQYTGSIRSYDDIEEDDKTSHQGEATVFYRIFPKLSLLGGGSYTLINRQEESNVSVSEEIPDYSDSKEYAGYGGIRYEATEQITGIVKVGALYKDFGEDYFDDTTEIYVSGEVNAAFSDTSSLNVRLSRNISETSQADESLIYGPYYLTTRLEANMTYGLPAFPKLSLLGDFSYRHETYPEDEYDRSDDSLELGVGVDYTFLKFIIVGAKYQYSSTDSTVDTNDFTDHSAMMRIEAKM